MSPLPRPLFRDRTHAGRILAHALDSSRGARPVVVALARGGLPVAREIAHHLGAPLEVLVAQALVLPGGRVPLAAFADGGGVFLDHAIWSLPQPQRDWLDAAALELVSDLSEAGRVARAGRPIPSFEGRRVILVDDGLLDGLAMAAAADTVRRRGARAIIGAAPVASPEAISRLQPLLDEVVCAAALRPLESVAGCYRDYHPVTHLEAQALRSSAEAELAQAGAAAH